MQNISESVQSPARNHQQLADDNQRTTVRSARHKARLGHRRQSRSKETLKPESGFSFTRACSPKLNGSLQQYRKIIDDLKSQNALLKKEIIELKVNEFYRFDENKVKELIAHAENLRLENRQFKRKLDDAELVRDFMERSNLKLKQQCQHLIKSLMNRKMGYDSTFESRPAIGESQRHQNSLSRSDLKLSLTPTKRRPRKYPRKQLYSQILPPCGESDPNTENEGNQIEPINLNGISKISSMGSLECRSFQRSPKSGEE